MMIYIFCTERMGKYWGLGRSASRYLLLKINNGLRLSSLNEQLFK
jgi:hypothetical protein